MANSAPAAQMPVKERQRMSVDDLAAKPSRPLIPSCFAG
jgi:hypothetical protein